MRGRIEGEGDERKEGHKPAATSAKIPAMAFAGFVVIIACLIEL